MSASVLNHNLNFIQALLSLYTQLKVCFTYKAVQWFEALTFSSDHPLSLWRFLPPILLSIICSGCSRAPCAMTQRQVRQVSVCPQAPVESTWIECYPLCVVLLQFKLNHKLLRSTPVHSVLWQIVHINVSCSCCCSYHFNTSDMAHPKTLVSNTSNTSLWMTQRHYVW